ncbi:MAG: hypothetical protein WCB01_11555 [Candidatus Cybelea sp.]
MAVLVTVLEELEREAAQEAIARLDVAERASARVERKIKCAKKAASLVRHAVEQRAEVRDRQQLELRVAGDTALGNAARISVRSMLAHVAFQDFPLVRCEIVRAEKPLFETSAGD